MNKVFFSGNITKDVQISMSKAGKPIANITIAVRQDYKTDGEYKSDFFSCVAFGATAEFIGNYLTKGSKVLVVGKLKNEQWEKDGTTHYMTKVIIENIEGLDKKKTESKQSEGMESFGDSRNMDDIPF